MQKTKLTLLLFLMVNMPFIVPVFAHGTGTDAPQPVQRIQGWQASDYQATLASSLTCGLCYSPEVPGVTTVGCQRHFPVERSGICNTCLFQPDSLPLLLQGGLFHTHTLASGREHTCLISAGTLLDMFTDQGLLEVLPEGREQELQNRRKENARRLKNAKAKSQIRKLQQERRILDWQIHRLPLQRQYAGFHGWISEFRTKYASLDGAREQLDALPGLCTTCGGYPQEHAERATHFRTLVTMGQAIWPSACPACLRNYAPPNTNSCATITCRNCLDHSGEATRFCIVCRRTTRGKAILYPGKPALDHSACSATMKLQVGDPGTVGSFDLCTCP